MGVPDPFILTGDHERSARAPRRTDESARRGGPDWLGDRPVANRERARRDPSAPRRGARCRTREGRAKAFQVRSLRDDLARRAPAREMSHVRRAQVLRCRHRAAVRGVRRRLDRTFAVSVTDETLAGLALLLRTPYLSET